MAQHEPVHRRPKVPEPPEDVWRERARRYDAGVKSRWATPDSSRQYIESQLDGQSSVLDIGAGTGSWTAYLAQTASELGHGIVRKPTRSAKQESIDPLMGAQWPDRSRGLPLAVDE